MSCGLAGLGNTMIVAATSRAVAQLGNSRMIGDRYRRIGEPSRLRSRTGSAGQATAADRNNRDNVCARGTAVPQVVKGKVVMLTQIGAIGPELDQGLR